MKPRVGRICTVLLAFGLLLAGAHLAQATVTGYVANPTGNSVDWTTAVNGLGGYINTTVNFNNHPTGTLQNNFYAGIGVTLTPSGDVNTVANGAGPGDPDTWTLPTSSGEGLHPASNYLSDAASYSTLTIDFATPVLGMGFFVIDNFHPSGWNETYTLAAYTGSGGTGTWLGTFNSPAYNFQTDNMYFMGVVSTDMDIGSVVITDFDAHSTDVTGIDDIRFASGSPVPLPPAVWLLGSGLLGLLGLRRFKQ